jgi:hypothetical protein
MSERSNVSIAEILGDNYYIDKLTSSDYSPAVGDTVTITLLVKDVFGDPVTGQTRTVTCTGGQFVSMNGTSITASSSVDVTTSSSGTVTLGLSVSVADNIIVSDGRAECVVSSLSDSITNLVTVERVSFVKTNANLTNHSSVDLTATITIPSGYKVLDYYTRNYTGVTDVSRLDLNGTTLSVRGWNHTGQTQSNVYIYVGVLYIRDI